MKLAVLWQGSFHSSLRVTSLKNSGRLPLCPWACTKLALSAAVVWNGPLTVQYQVRAWPPPATVKRHSKGLAISTIGTNFP